MSTGVGVTDGCWYKRWLSIVSLSGSHYHLPGGSVGRKYVDQLTHELSHFSAGNYPSERFIIFSSVVLQRDRSVVKGADIRRVIERRLIMWDKGDFDLLVQEAERCDKSLRPRTKFNHDKTHTATVFTRLMLQGKVKAAVRWLSDNTKGKVLRPDDKIPVKLTDGSTAHSSVADVLRIKHPDSQVPPHSALLSCDSLPAFEDIEVTGNVIQRAASVIQGSAGCDASHWQDALLRYGAHSSHLRDQVASVARRLANSIVPWSDIRGFVASRLIALDKNPGVRPIGVGESYHLSRRSTEVIVNSLKNNTPFQPGIHLDTLLSSQSESHKAEEVMHEERFDQVVDDLSPQQKRAVLRAKDSKLSSWLNVLPIAKNHSETEFRDALSIRYKKPLPINCDGCGSPFDLSHALSCRRGGLVTQRHNEVRDAIGDLAALAWGQVTKEPVVREGDNNTPALIADLAVRGVWTAQTEALFDVRVIDTDAQSYSCQTPPAVLTAAEKEKKRKYSAACEERRALFTVYQWTV